MIITIISGMVITFKYWPKSDEIKEQKKDNKEENNKNTKIIQK